MGGGIASRFNLAVSRVMDTPLSSENDISEIMQLVSELNGHQDLTVKLNNQTKIVNNFLKGNKFKKGSLDPQIQ